MRKLFFILAFMLVGGFSFATSINSNFEVESIYKYGICTYSITQTTTHPDGTITRVSKTYTVEAFSESNCQWQMNQHVSLLNAGILEF